MNEHLDTVLKELFLDTLSIERNLGTYVRNILVYGDSFQHLDFVTSVDPIKPRLKMRLHRFVDEGR